MHDLSIALPGWPAVSNRPRKPKLTAAKKLAARAQVAADVRAYDTNPDVIAYKVERMRARVDRLMWAGIIAGLASPPPTSSSSPAGGSASPSGSPCFSPT
ncbi:MULTISPECIES: hypothetical protein [unclassified Nonomuraea]|uniref:hypothetical protein n=1 Tax=unclassified Nonomuraea TaxID=2593643 RepID=UPI0033EED6F9